MRRTQALGFPEQGRDGVVGIHLVALKVDVDLSLSAGRAEKVESRIGQLLAAIGKLDMAPDRLGANRNGAALGLGTGCDCENQEQVPNQDVQV